MSGLLGSSSARILFNILLLLASSCVARPYARAIECPVIPSRPSSPADLAFLASDYEKSASLYRAELAQDPHKTESQIGLVHTLLRQQKIEEAGQIASAAAAAQPNSAALATLRGEVEYRSGFPWLTAHSATESEKLDPCNPSNMLLIAKVARLNSLYATAQREIVVAHRIAPNDPEITREWINTLPAKQRMQQIEDFVSRPEGLDPESLAHLRMYLEHLQRLDADSRKTCHLASSETATQIPFTRIMYDANRIRAFGLEVKLNDRTARLEIDTGAGGLLVSRSVAQRAGLKPFSQTKVGGIGNQGDQSGYTAYADSIRIGKLEFKDCIVEVLDTRHGLGDVDGLIGMDVFSQFLITLDYPMQKLLLGPLPPRPGETANPSADLETEGVNTGDAKSPEQPPTPAPANSSSGVVEVDHGQPDRKSVV